MVLTHSDGFLANFVLKLWFWVHFRGPKVGSWGHRYIPLRFYYLEIVPEYPIYLMKPIYIVFWLVWKCFLLFTCYKTKFWPIFGPKIWVMVPQEYPVQYCDKKMLSKSSYQLQNMVVTWFLSVWGSLWLRVCEKNDGFWRF